MNNTLNKYISTAFLLFIITSCGKAPRQSEQKVNSIPQTQLEEAPLDGSNIQGHYQAKFITLNPHVNGTIPGSANFFRPEGEDRIYAYVRLFAGGVRAWHRQHVYTGQRCPTLDDDLNLDGFIDINEAERVLGNILIPLDSNISTQEAGQKFFPVADLSGSYHYERVTRFSRFLNNLQEEDKDLEDNTIKLPPGSGLRLIGKPVLIQGVAQTIDFPDTVATQGKFKAFQTLPIACGIFAKVTDSLGTPYEEDIIPGPVAEVEDGQDRPIEEDLPRGTGEDSNTRGNGTNDADDGEGPVSDGEDRAREEEAPSTEPEEVPENENDEEEDDEEEEPEEESPV